MKHKKLTGFKKYIPSKKIKDFIYYYGCHMLYQPTNRPSKYIFHLCLVFLKNLMKMYLLICFETSKLHEIKKWQSTK